jgi:hypothetical protein
MNDLSGEDYQLMINKVASLVHEKFKGIYKKYNSNTRIKITTDREWIEKHGTNRVDLAKIAYHETPQDWRLERWLGAKVAVDALIIAARNGNALDEDFVERVASDVHAEWLRRNASTAKEQFKLPYGQLSERDKCTDRVFVLSAIEIYKET